MLSNLHAIISKGYLAIDEQHDKLLTSVRTGYADELNYEDVEENFKLINEPFKVPVQLLQSIVTFNPTIVRFKPHRGFPFYLFLESP